MLLFHLFVWMGIGLPLLAGQEVTRVIGAEGACLHLVTAMSRHPELPSSLSGSTAHRWVVQHLHVLTGKNDPRPLALTIKPCSSGGPRTHPHLMADSFPQMLSDGIELSMGRLVGCIRPGSDDRHVNLLHLYEGKEAIRTFIRLTLQLNEGSDLPVSEVTVKRFWLWGDLRLRREFHWEGRMAEISDLLNTSRNARVHFGDQGPRGLLFDLLFLRDRKQTEGKPMLLISIRSTDPVLPRSGMSPQEVVDFLIEWLEIETEAQAESEVTRIAKPMPLSLRVDHTWDLLRGIVYTDGSVLAIMDGTQPDTIFDPVHRLIYLAQDNRGASEWKPTFRQEEGIWQVWRGGNWERANRSEKEGADLLRALFGETTPPIVDSR